jgi:hypothetical protein
LQLVASLEPYQNALGAKSFASYDLPTTNTSTTTTANVATDVTTTEATSTATVSRASLAARLVAVGSYDGKVRLISTDSWKIAFILPLIDPHAMNAGLIYSASSSIGSEVDINTGSSLLPPLMTVEVALDDDSILGVENMGAKQLNQQRQKR